MNTYAIFTKDKKSFTVDGAYLRTGPTTVCVMGEERWPVCVIPVSELKFAMQMPTEQEVKDQ